MKGKGLRIFVTVGQIVVFALGLSPTWAATATSKGVPTSAHGYSIFDETMVDMTWRQVEKAAKEGAVILFPIGVIEEHGPHMGLGVDTYLAYLKCKLVRQGLETRGIQALIAPPFYWGINNNTGSFPGSFTVRKETMKAVLHDTLASFRRWGFDYLFVINHHGDTEHNLTILDAIKEARMDTGMRAFYVLPEFDAKVRFRLTGREHHVLLVPAPESQERPEYLDVHAGRGETGLMAHYFPDQVKVEVARTLKSTNLTLRDLAEWDHSWSDARKMTPMGYFGDPANFDPEASRQKMEDFVNQVVNLIESFMKAKGLMQAH